VAELWHDPQVDAVVIATPARTHADLVVAAADAGKGVFCEKPMAVTLPDADRAIDAARRSGVVLQVGSTGAGDVAVAEDPEAAGEQTLSLAVACGVLRA
jgi:predicted dehydrogenase